MTPRSPKYDTEAHATRVRELLTKRIERLPLAALVKLQEAASLLETGEHLAVLSARERLGTLDGVQVQPRYNVDGGQVSEARANLAYRLAEEAEAATPSRYAWHRKRRPGTVR